MGTLFNANFENFKLWDKPPGNGVEFVNVTGGSLSVEVAAAYSGSYGLRVTPVSNSARTAYAGFHMRTPQGLRRFRQRFWLHPNSISIASGNQFRIARNYHPSYNFPTYTVRLGYTTGVGYYVIAGLYNGDLDDQWVSDTPSRVISNDWHMIETDFLAAASGYIQLWVDDVYVGQATGDNRDAAVWTPCVGVGYPATSGFAVSGSFFIDEWVANDDGTAIGEAIESPSASPSVSPSLSPSASVSPSKSPSASASPSAAIPSFSVSPSLSPSASRSPSISVSPSVSPSRSPSISVSPSISPSRSPSASLSISPSASASPSLPPGACVVESDSGIQVRYYVALKDQSGAVVAVFDDFNSFEISKKVNDVGSYTISFVDDGDARFDLFELDGQVEFYRSVVGRAPWYLEFEALHRNPKRSLDSQGLKTFESMGLGYNDLLARTTIAYKAGTIRADKSVAAETAMKEYTEENCGPTADDTVVGRLYQGGLPNFTVDADLGKGSVWTGSAAYENLLETLQEISLVSGVDFEVVGNGPASFLFRTSVGQIGQDRTNQDLNADTGMNGAGNPPIVFDTMMSTSSNMEYENNRMSEANVVIVLGKGDGSTRHTVTRYDTTAINDSPWNRREISRPASNVNEDYETYSMNTFGDQVLEEMQAKEVFTFNPMQQPSLLYGRDYAIGDRVTARFGSIERHKRIIGVRLRVENLRETIELEFADISKERL